MPTTPRTLNATEVTWQLQHPDGRRAHAIILPTGPTVSAIWFLDGREQTSRSFATTHGAIRWLERELVKLQVAGWLFWTNHA